MLSKIAPISALLFAFSTQATVPCEDPFAGERTQFILTEPLTCDPTQAVYKIQIKPSAYLTPSCVGNHKVLDLYLNNGQNIRSFSNEQAGEPGWGNLQVSSSCTGKNLFTISPDYQIPGVGSVSPAENTVNSVILRNNTQVIANATKNLISEGSCGKAIWTVTNNPSLSPQVMAYLLALKDNALFNCNTPAPATHDSSWLSAAAVAGISAAIVLPTTIGSFFLYRWIHRNHPWVFKRKTYEPLQEAL